MVAVWSRLHPSEQPRPGRGSLPWATLDCGVDSAVHVGRRTAEARRGRRHCDREHVVERLPLASDAERPSEQDAPTMEARTAARASRRRPGRTAADGASARAFGPRDRRGPARLPHRCAPRADVRCRRTASSRLVVDGLVVDGRHVGSMLRYDRRAEQGPWLLRRMVRIFTATPATCPGMPWRSWTGTTASSGSCGRTSIPGCRHQVTEPEGSEGLPPPPHMIA